ncbi:hypothetical protein GGG16DRAFT_119268 [Schizophyllum commune]
MPAVPCIGLPSLLPATVSRIHQYLSSSSRRGADATKLKNVDEPAQDYAGLLHKALQFSPPDRTAESSHSAQQRVRSPDALSTLNAPSTRGWKPMPMQDYLVVINRLPPPASTQHAATSRRPSVKGPPRPPRLDTGRRPVVSPSAIPQMQERCKIVTPVGHLDAQFAKLVVASPQPIHARQQQPPQLMQQNSELSSPETPVIANSGYLSPPPGPRS